MGNIVLPTNVVVGDPDLVPGNVKTGVNILGTIGTYKGLRMLVPIADLRE
jgi:hypothetical protein